MPCRLLEGSESCTPAGFLAMPFLLGAAAGRGWAGRAVGRGLAAAEGKPRLGLLGTALCQPGMASPLHSNRALTKDLACDLSAKDKIWSQLTHSLGSWKELAAAVGQPALPRAALYGPTSGQDGVSPAHENKIWLSRNITLWSHVLAQPCPVVLCRGSTF